MISLVHHDRSYGVPMTWPDPAPRPPFGYLDAVGGQPLLPAAAAAWQAAAAQGWADPARLHGPGRRAGLLLDTARASLAGHLGIRPEDLFLTSSGPTAVQAAIRGLGLGGRIVLGAVESMAVQEPAGGLGREVAIVPVDDIGRIDLQRWQEALAPDTSLACLQAANPEVGTRQPVQEAAAACREAGVPLLVHAVQVLGRDGVPDHWDLLAASARDFGGPAGVGMLAVRPGLGWRPDQSPDRGWVSGFPDIPGAAAAAAAWEYLEPEREHEAARGFELIARLRRDLPAAVDGLAVVGADVDRLPHILTMVIDGVVGEALVHELSRSGLSAASGSACTNDARMPSQVLMAMGLRDRTSLRISLPLGVDEESVDAFVAELPSAVGRLR